MAAFGGLGFATTAPGCQADQARAGREARQGAGVPLRRGRLVPERSRQPRLQQGPLLLGRARALRRAHGVQSRTSWRSPGWRARSRATRTARSGRSPSARTPAGRTTRPSPRATSSTRGSGSSIPPPRRPTPPFLYDIKNGEAFNKKQITDAKRGRRPRQGRLDLEVTLEGPRGYFPCSPPISPRCPAISARWRSSATSGRRPATSLQRPLRPRDLGAQQADDAPEEPVLLRGQGRSPHQGGHSHHPGRPRARCPTRTTRSTSPSLQAGDLKRLQSDPRAAKDVFRYPFPGTWYLLPAGDEGSLRQRRRCAGRSVTPSTATTW